MSIPKAGAVEPAASRAAPPARGGSGRPAAGRRLGPGLRAAFAAAALAAVLSSSCVESAPAGPTIQLVPQGALAAIVVDSPYKLYEAAEAFWKASGFDKAAGSDLKGLLEKSVPPSSGALDVLDFSRPWALALLPAAPRQGAAEGSGSAPSGGKRTRTLVYVPYRSSPEELIKKLVGDGSFVPVAKAKGYIVLSDEGEQIRFPPAKAADLGRLKRYPASALKLWADPAALRRATQDGFKPIARAARRFVTDPAERRAADPAAFADTLADFGASFLSQLELADASLEPGPAGLVIRAGASSAAGSDLRKAIAAAASGPSALDWASQVDSGALLGASWAIDGRACPELGDRLLQGLFAALGLPPEAVARASALQAKWAAAKGPRGAMNLDMEVDAEAMAAIREGAGGGDSSALLAKALKIKFDTVREARDRAAYERLLRGLDSDPDFLSLSKAYGDVFGLSFSAASRDLKEGAFPYGEIGFRLEVSDEAKLRSLGGGASATATAAALRAFGEQLTTRWTITQGRLAATNGDAAALKALSARKAAARSLASDPSFAAFAKTMPPKSVFIGSISMRKLLSLAATSGDPAARTRPDPSQFGSWYFYLAADTRWGSPGIEAGFFVPASDLRAFASSGAGPMKIRDDAQNGGV